MAIANPTETALCQNTFACLDILVVDLYDHTSLKHSDLRPTMGSLSLPMRIVAAQGTSDLAQNLKVHAPSFQTARPPSNMPLKCQAFRRTFMGESTPCV